MKNYCPELFQNLYIEKVNESQVELGFCCVAKRSAPTDQVRFDLDFLEDQRKFYLETETLPFSCAQCITDESIGSTSRRLNELYHRKLIYPDNVILLENNLTKLQYNCDTICNLKCIMCGSFYSSSWVEDEIQLGKIPKKQFRITKHNDLIFQFDTSKINFIYFNGGEPLMTKDHMRVLSYLKENSDSKKIYVCYNTNATLKLTDELINLWSDFAEVTLVASIDAIGKAYEYIRFPANWNLVEQNLNEYKETVTLNIGANIGIHNIMYFNDLYEFAYQNNIQFNFQSDTQGHLSLKNTPLHLVPVIKEQLHKSRDSEAKSILLNTLDLVKKPDLTWLSFLYSLDKIRNNDWTQSLSRLYNLDPAFFDEYKNIPYKV